MKNLFGILVLAMMWSVVPVLPVFSQNETDDESEEEGGVSKYGDDSATCVMNISLYYEFYKQWKQSDYKNNAVRDAIAPWRWVFLNCPESTQNIYIHGLTITEHRIQNETDKDRRERLIDTLLMVYDRRIQYYGKEGYNLGRKGVDLYKLRPNAYEETYHILGKSIELQGNKSEGPVLIYYFRAAEKMVKAEKLDKMVLVDIYDQVSQIIDFNLKKYAGDNRKLVNWENIKGNIELSFEPYATCEDLISIYAGKFESNPEDIDLLKKITKILDKKKCTDSDLFFSATEKLHKLEPTANSAYLMGKMYIKKENYARAATYLQEATLLFEDDNDRADAHFLLANVYYQQHNYSAARNQCYEVLKVRPEDGSAFILIGDMYAASAKDCGDNELTERVAYWAAVDKYIKARSVDPTVAEVANTKINTFSQYFPATETIFFHDLKKGDPYKVECWINEMTTVRSSD
ncbi:MAG: tetratricopeptide repeat protein [Bacteroidales bacterium]|nr:tetratricopeptide repeat protein [Bacteroidales bacterium]